MTVGGSQARSIDTVLAAGITEDYRLLLCVALVPIDIVIMVSSDRICDVPMVIWGSSSRSRHDGLPI